MKKDQTMTDIDLKKQGVKYVMSNKFHELSQSQQKKGAALNLDDKGEGTHWVGMKESPIKGVYNYYDSYGIRPSYGILKNSVILYNSHQDQKFNETNCGQRVVKFLKKK